MRRTPAGVRGVWEAQGTAVGVMDLLSARTAGLFNLRSEGGRPAPVPRGSCSQPGLSGLAGLWGSPRGRAGRDRPFFRVTSRRCSGRAGDRALRADAAAVTPGPRSPVVRVGAFS